MWIASESVALSSIAHRSDLDHELVVAGLGQAGVVQLPQQHRDHEHEAVVQPPEHLRVSVEEDVEGDGEGEDLDEVGQEELRDGPGDSGGDEDVLAHPGEHGEAPHELPAGVEDQADHHGGVVDEEDEEAEHWGQSVQQGIEPLLPRLPVGEERLVLGRPRDAAPAEEVVKLGGVEKGEEDIRTHSFFR